MKRKILQKIGLCLFAISLLGNGYSQTKVMQVRYDLKTTTTYNFDKDFKENMSLYNKLKYAPTVIEEKYDESFYGDGHFEKEILHFFPNGLPEDWLKIPSKTIITKDSVFVYVGDVIFSRILRENDIDEIKVEEAAPLYLGTYQWKFPVSEDYVKFLEEEGFKVEINNASTLKYTNFEESYTWDNDLMVEEYTKFEEGEKVHVTTIGYKKDSLGYFIRDYHIERNLICEDNHCAEQVVSQQYGNIVRIYLDPSLEPSAENGYEYGEEISYPTITAHQLGATNQIKVLFSDDCPDELIINVSDLFGTPKMTNITVTRDNNTFIANSSLTLGVHTIQVTNNTVLPCTFIYMP